MRTIKLDYMRRKALFEASKRCDSRLGALFQNEHEITALDLNYASSEARQCLMEMMNKYQQLLSELSHLERQLLRGESLPENKT